MPAGVFDKRWKRGAFLAFVFIAFVTAAALIDRRAEQELNQKLDRDIALVHDRLEGFPVAQTPTRVSSRLRDLGLNTGPINIGTTRITFTVEEHSWWRYGCITVLLNQEESVKTNVDYGKCDPSSPS